jgi:hypothetical protein
MATTVRKRKRLGISADQATNEASGVIHHVPPRLASLSANSVRQVSGKSGWQASGKSG